MKSSGKVIIQRAVLVLSAAVLLVLAAVALNGVERAAAFAAPLFQDPTSYPPFPTLPPFDDPYPYPVGTPTDDFQPTPQITVPPVLPSPTQRFSPPTQAVTQPPNTFLTEDAQIGEGLVTPQGPTSTRTATLTATPTPGDPTSQPTPVIVESGGSSGGVNWGLFWIGFSLPVLAACGWVLYLLDRRPELFRPKG